MPSSSQSSQVSTTYKVAPEAFGSNGEAGIVPGVVEQPIAMRQHSGVKTRIYIQDVGTVGFLRLNPPLSSEQLLLRFCDGLRKAANAKSLATVLEAGLRGTGVPLAIYTQRVR